MFKQNGFAARISIVVSSIILLGLVLCTTPCRVIAQTTDAGDLVRQRVEQLERGFQFIQERKFAEAQKEFERLTATDPKDGQAFFGLGIALLGVSKNVTDAEARKEMRFRARNSLLRAKDLGVDNDLLEIALKEIPEDGSDPARFSKNAEAEKAMQEGEAAFARNDYDEAITHYQRALQLDPQLYDAALFIGDMYFSKKQPGKAGEWYARAIAINPDRETAYRYWSDVLLKSNKMEESRAKAIDAIIAEPYDRTSYRGLVQWAQVNKVTLNHPKINQPKPSMSASTDGGQTTITVEQMALDPKQGPAYYWSFYDHTRSTYPTASFAKDHPTESAYRHSLQEEATALRIVAEMAAKDLKAGKLKESDDPSLTNLVKLYEADLIEPYILFVRPDAGIARDYAAYRQANRDKLRRYWAEFVIGK